MRLDRKALYVPAPQEILTVMGTLDSHTVTWALSLTEPGTWAPRPHGDHLTLKGRVIAARFETGLDSRLRTQAESIERLLTHLKNHCPALLGTGPCILGGEHERADG